MLTTILVKCLIFIVASLFLFLFQFLLLRMFDRLLEIDFKEAFNKIEQDPKAMAFYFGMRFFSVTISLGLIVCLAIVL